MDTKREIIQAGIKVFTRRGFQGATVDEIARTAGISRATFYLYFPSKTELSVEIGTQGVPSKAKCFESLVLLATPSFAEVRAWVDEFVADWKKHRTSNVIGFRGSVSSSKFAEVNAGILGSIIDRLEPIVERRQESERPATRARLAVLIFQLELTLFEIFEHRPNNADALVDALAVMWHRELAMSDTRHEEKAADKEVG